MPEGPFRSAILATAARPSEVEPAVSESADEGVAVRTLGSEAQPAHATTPTHASAVQTRRACAEGESVIVRPGFLANTPPQH